MNTARTIAPIIVGAALLLGCGSDPAGPETGISITDLVGSWIATSDTHTNAADAAETFEIIAAGGEVRFTMLAGGDTRIWVDFGGVSDEWDSAVTLNGNTLTADPVEAGRPTRVWTVTLVDGVLTMTDTGAEFDFTLTGATPVSSTEVITFVRS